MTDNFQSGKTQAIDLDELHVDSANRPSEYKVRGEFELDKWGDDPWNSTEESRKRRRWAEDDRWYGDDEEKNNQNEAMWDADEETLKAGWHAPKRGDVLVTSEGWDDWDNFGGAPKELEQEQESKDFGGYRRVQAASQYAQVDTSNYVDGRAQRDDLYRSKEVFGTSGVKERKGDPYADIMQQRNAPMPEMKPISEWNEEPPAADKKEKEEEEDMRASAKISNLAQSSVDDIPGVTRASIIIFQADTEPVVYELKKIVTSIGRGLDNMVILNDQYASRKHLSINYVGGRFELAALSVDNIASVNGYPITRVMLKNEDQIEVGATRIKFVVGPISEAHMTLRAPKNGKPIHLVPPPREVRSPKTTKKNLILLIAVVAVIVIFVVSMLVFMLWRRDSSVPENAVAKTETEEQVKEESNAEPTPSQNLPTLQQSDKNIVEGMMEAYSLGTGHYVSTAGSVMGDKIRIKITTEPEGARIYNQDGSLRGKTPYEYDEHVTGDREETWTIRLDGYLEQVIKVNLNAAVNEDLKLEPENAPKPEPPKAAPKPKPKAKPKAKPKGGSGGKKPAKKGGSGSSGRIMI